MRTTVDRSSPWGHRLWFEDREFDAMMDEVRLKAGQVTVTPGEGVDVWAIFQNVYRVEPDYVDLPDSVLGKTIFHRDGRFDVYLSRTLTDEAEDNVVARRRLRATAAHECAHVVIHGHLHLVDSLTVPMFADSQPPPPRVLCRKDAIGRLGYSGEWWEFQANRGMAALLLPRAMVGARVQQTLAERGCASLEDAMRAGQLEAVIRDLMQHFDVSMQLVTYRLQQLGFLPKSTDQTTLALEAREQS